MADGSSALLVLSVLVWGTLAALVVVFLRMALRSDGGFGAVGRGHPRRAPRRPSHVSPVAIPPRHLSPSQSGRHG